MRRSIVRAQVPSRTSLSRTAALGLVLVFGSLLFPLQATATEPKSPETTDVPEGQAKPEPLPKYAKHALTYSNLTGFRYNALGLFNAFSLGYRYQLFDRPGPLFEDSYIAIKSQTFIAPPYGRVGVAAEIQPLAVLKLSASYAFEGVFGILNLTQSYTSPEANFSDSALKAGGDAGRNYKTHGHVVQLGALLQAKVWKIAVRNDFKAIYTNFQLNQGHTVYYNQALDVLAPNDGWILTNDSDLLYISDFGLKFGARYTMTHSVYTEDHWPGGSVKDSPNGPMHRIGPAILYTFFNRPQARFNTPTVFLLTQWWAKHRYRTGRDVSAGLPQFLIGFVFTGQLTKPRR